MEQRTELFQRCVEALGVLWVGLGLTVLPEPAWLFHLHIDLVFPPFTCAAV